MYLEDCDLIGLQCGPSTSSSNLLRDSPVQPGGTGAQCEQARPVPGGGWGGKDTTFALRHSIELT